MLLLAFAMQLALVAAQTHTHSDRAGHVFGFGRSAGQSASQVAWAKSLAGDFCRKAQQRSCDAPVVPRSDHCPICLSVTLASAGVLQAPPVMPPTPARAILPLPDRDFASLSGTDTVHFQARAPPSA
jgi:hypothetical protein